MKALLAFVFCLSSVVSSTQAQPVPATPSGGVPALPGTIAPGSPPASAQLVLTGRELNTRSWSWITWETGPTGEQVAVTNSSYLEIGTDLCYRDNGGQLRDSAEVILPVPGGAEASQGQTVVFWPNNLTNGAIQIQMPDGRQLATSPRFLAYADDTGKSVLLGEIKDCQGRIVPPNSVVYEDVCPDDIKGVTLRFTYHLWGLEAEVLFTGELPPEPPAFQMSAEPGKCALQMWTEWSADEEPTVTASGVPAALSWGTDVEVNFGGTMRIGAGKAFSLVPERKGPGLAVQKQFGTVEGSQYLIEQVSAPDFFKLAALPAKEGASLTPAVDREHFLATTLKGLPGRRLAVRGGPAMEVAAVRPAAKGAYIDYTLINSSLTNYVFRSDTTYYVSSLASLYATTTLEGGTVIKFTNSPSVELSLNGPLVCNTTGYEPATLTCRMDNTIGAGVASGTPTSSNGATYMDAAAGQTNAYTWLRFCYAGEAIRGVSLTNGIWHCQFVQCGTAVESTGSDPMPLRNVLISQCTNAVVTPGSFTGEHLTVDQCATLLSGSGSSGTLTNSVLTAVTNLGNITATEGTSQFDSGSGLYQTVAGGAYYLGAWTNNGSSGLNSQLLADLQTLTTYPPIMLPATITNNTTLSPQAQCDTGVPLPGYHYAPVDYLASNVTLFATLTLPNRVSVGLCGSYGFAFAGSGGLTSAGLPRPMNALVTARLVQEQPIGLGGSTLFSLGASAPTINLTFANIALAQGSLGTLGSVNGLQYPTPNLYLTDCVLSGAYFIQQASALGNTTDSLMNNLLDRCTFDLYTHPAISNYYCAVTMRNNLFRSGTLYVLITFGESTPWQLKDNLFDLCNNTLTGDNGTNYITRDHNAFTTNTVNGLGGTSNKTNLVADYQTGLLGMYYYPTNGGAYSLTNLINAGSASAASVNLDQFTTTTNQVKEGSTTVDIGYHYVVMNTPAIAQQPVDLAVAQGGNATFSVTVTNTLFFDSQWQLNGTNIAGATFASYTRTNAQPVDAGSYSVVVADIAGKAQSAAAVLTVVPGDWFVKYWGTNYLSNTNAALSADPDNDGLNNLQEYLRGRNPLANGTVPDVNGLINLEIFTPLE